MRLVACGTFKANSVLKSQRIFLPYSLSSDCPSLQLMVADAGKVTCMLADHLSNTLWMGHSDGKVSAYSMGDAPGTAVNGQLLHCWQVMFLTQHPMCTPSFQHVAQICRRALLRG